LKRKISTNDPSKKKEGAASAWGQRRGGHTPAGTPVNVACDQKGTTRPNTKAAPKQKPGQQKSKSKKKRGRTRGKKVNDLLKPTNEATTNLGFKGNSKGETGKRGERGANCLSFSQTRTLGEKAVMGGGRPKELGGNEKIKRITDSDLVGGGKGKKLKKLSGLFAKTEVGGGKEKGWKNVTNKTKGAG